MDLAGLSPTAAVATAAAAGVVSFLSPCVAPLLPGYVAFVAGPVGSEGHRSVTRSVGFVAGFVTLFALLGASAAAFSRELSLNRSLLELVSGLLVALCGLAMAFDRSLVPMASGHRLQQRSARLGAPATFVSAMPVGAAFAVAWTPCIGPALAAILVMASGTSQPGWGATLLVAYGVGLGLPFVLGAVALGRIQSIARALRAHARAIRIGSGALLMILGLAIATGGFGQVTARLARTVPDWLT